MEEHQGKKEFKHLEFEKPPKGKLPEGFDLEKHSERPIVEISEKDKKIVIEYVFPGFSLTDHVCEVEGKEIVFKSVTISSTGVLYEPGKPLLPSFGRYVQIPYDSKLVEVHVEFGLKVAFPDVLVFPAQLDSLDRDKKAHVLDYDKHFYSLDALYPETDQIVRVSGPFSIDGYFALLVHVTPFQYEPKERELIGYGSIKLTLSLELEGAEGPEIYEGRSGQLEASGNFFLNPAIGIEERLGFPPRCVVLPSSGPEYLIIHAEQEEFKKAAIKLAQWKNSRGLITEAVSISQAGGHVSRKIKRYIDGRRKSPLSRLRYVLLLGDVDTIPLGPHNSDYYYSTKDIPVIPVNSNNDLVFPWLSIGRIPVSTADSLLVMGVVDKIIAYEKYPPVDQNYYRRIVLATEYDSRLPTVWTMERIYTALGDPPFVIDRIYMVPLDPNPSPPYYPSSGIATGLLVPAISEGRLIVAQLDHGEPKQWIEPKLDLQDLDAVTGSTPSIFYIISCCTGQFDLAQGDCLAEKMLKMQGAAASLIAANETTSLGGCNEGLMLGLFDGVFGGVLKVTSPSCPVNNCRIGDVLNYGKSFLPIAISGVIDPAMSGNANKSADLIESSFRRYHVIGDPTLEQWTAFPHLLLLEARLVHAELHIYLRVSPKGCVLTIWHDTELVRGVESQMLMRIESPPRRLTIPCPSQVPASIGHCLRVCCWAPGYRFAEARVRLP